MILSKRRARAVAFVSSSVSRQTKREMHIGLLSLIGDLLKVTHLFVLTSHEELDPEVSP
jgi:hypothetical protein